MKRLAILGAVCSLVLAAIALTVSTVRAQTPEPSTVTFHLTINGSPPPGDSFTVQWGETGLELCAAPCIGGGHSYIRTMSFPKGVTETFIFVRAFGRVTPGHPGQKFGTQAVTVTSDRSVRAFFTYGTTTVPTPSTGSAPSVQYGATIAGLGAVMVLFSLRRSRSDRLPRGRRRRAEPAG
jgi:hypothetical protein